MSEDEMAGWHHQCSECELGQTLGAKRKLETELNGEFESRVVSELDRLTGSSGTVPESAE